jgi:spoIIIJ-associated protein
MEWVETTGRTIEDALDAALDRLGVHEEEVEYSVLAEPKSGLFGRFGGSEARIRARVKPISREKPNPQRRRRGGRAERPERGERGERAARSGARGSGSGRSKGAPSDANATNAAVVAAAGDGDGDGERTGGGTRRRRRRRKPAGVESRGDEGDTMERMEREADVPIEEQAEAAEVFTRGVVDAFGFGAPALVKAKVEPEDGNVIVEITGENLGLLVGPKGATLHALEELVRTVVQRQTGGHGVRINVDVAGYRAKRRAALEEFTQGVAERVIETGREHALEPMSSPDRKVVHDVAAEIEGVETISEGEEPRRRVVIRPA